MLSRTVVPVVIARTRKSSSPVESHQSQRDAESQREVPAVPAVAETGVGPPGQEEQVEPHLIREKHGKKRLSDVDLGVWSVFLKQMRLAHTRQGFPFFKFCMCFWDGDVCGC